MTVSYFFNRKKCDSLALFYLMTNITLANLSNRTCGDCSSLYKSNFITNFCLIRNSMLGIILD